MNKKTLSRKNRHKRIRKKIFGTKSIPRLLVYKSLSYIYCQLVNDVDGKVIVSASSLSEEVKGKKLSKMEQSSAVGKLLAGKAKAKGVKKVVLDRAGYKYHGRIKTLAESIRKEGLTF